MDLICQDEKIPEDLHRGTLGSKEEKHESTSKKKEDQLRKFAKQIFNRHVTQA